MILDKIVVSFSLEGQKYFNYGQIYVALSRCKSLEGLHILGKIERSHVRVNSKVHEEYERLRKSNCLKMPAIVRKDKKESFVISLLNIRSLVKHSIDLKFDRNINDSDLILLTETQPLCHTDDEGIRNSLSTYTLQRQDHDSDKFCSLAICTKENIEIEEYEYLAALNIVKFVVLDRTTQFKQRIVLPYRKQRSNIVHFLEGIRYILLSNIIDIVLGDFNINYLKDDDVKGLKSLMDSLEYTQVVESATFISSGSLLDHVYVKSKVLPIIEHSVVSVYYSDYEDVKVKINLR